MRYKPVEVTRITVDPIKRANVAEIKTSLYVFARLLDQVQLRDACNGVGTTSPEMCRDLRNIVNKWVKADAEVVDHIISTFGVDCECTGKELFDSVKMAFMDILVNEKSTAEKTVKEFDLRSICSPLDAIEVGVKLNAYFQARKRLDPSVVGEPAYISRLVFNELPKLVRDEFDRVLRSRPYMIPESMLSLKVYDDLLLFARTVQLAVQSAVAYGDTPTMRASSHAKVQEEVFEEKSAALSWNYHKKLSTLGNSPVPCPKCGLHKCPLAVRSSAKCDVCEEPSAARLVELNAETPAYRHMVGITREKKKMSKIPGFVFPAVKPEKPARTRNFKKPKSNTHASAQVAPDAIEGERKLMWGDEMFDLIDSLAEKDFADEPVEEEAPKINFNGFRQAFFDGTDETDRRNDSSLRLGAHSLELEVAPSMESLMAKFEEARRKVVLERSAGVGEVIAIDVCRNDEAGIDIDSNSSVGQKLAAPEVDISLMETFGMRKEQVCSTDVAKIQTVIASSSGAHSATMQVVLFFIMVLSGLYGWANSPFAAVRAKVQDGSFDSSVALGVNRLALLRSWVPVVIALNGFTSQPVFLDTAQEVYVPQYVPQSVPQSCLSRASVPFFALSEGVHTEVSRIMHMWDCDVLEGISSEFCHEEVGSDSIAVASGSMASFRGDDQSFPIVRAGERLSGIGADFEVGFIHTEAFSFANHLIFSGKIVEMEKTYTCLMVQKPMVCAKYSLHENDWGANELFPAWQLNVWNGEDFLTSISESYANLHLQFWLGVSVSPAMVLLKGFASSNHKVQTPILLPVQISATVSHCPGGISVMPSRTVAKPSYLRLRGGGR